LQIGVRKSPLTQTIDLIKEGITNLLNDNDMQMENKYVDIITASIFARREELRKVLT
jgi:hypothetical protein